jgi:predicted DsbA family dithiol-disulfide isomerase
MKVEVWSDVVCPWCYIGKRRLEAALAQFEHADEVEVVWRSYELNPRAQPVSEGLYVERLARKYNVTIEQALAMNERVARIAEDEGLHYRFDIARPGNTLDAHRVIHLAAEHGLQDAMKERLLAAYQCEGEAIGDRAVLVRQAATVGLDSDEVAVMLESDRFVDEVRADEAAAEELAITGVPFFVMGRKAAVPGAQDVDTMLLVLERAWAKLEAARVAEADACGPDGCEVV